MLLAATNLGPIDSASLELRPLTVLLGTNGSGKTWLTHSCFKVRAADSKAKSSLTVERSELIAKFESGFDLLLLKRNATTSGQESISVTKIVGYRSATSVRAFAYSDVRLR